MSAARADMHLAPGDLRRLERCPLCAGTSLRDVLSLPRVSHLRMATVTLDVPDHLVLECGDCGLLSRRWVTPASTEEMLSALWADGDGESRRWSPAQQRGVTAIAARLDREVRSRFTADEMLRGIDIGVGEADFGGALGAGWELYGLDASTGSVASGAVGYSRIVQGNIEGSVEGLPAAHFHAAVMLDVLEHLSDPVRALVNVRRLLRPGGVLLVETANARCLPARLARILPWWYFGVLEHKVFWDAGTLEGLLARAGFEVTGIGLKCHKSGFSLRSFGGVAAYLVHRAAPGLFGHLARVMRRPGFIPGLPRFPWRDHLLAAATKPL